MRKTTAFLAVVLCLALTALLLSGCSAGIHHAEIVFEDYGTVTLELDGKTAPVTVRNFMKLAKSGFYDGLTLHRIADLGTGFIVQGGDPLGDGTGNSGTFIKGEFAANGHRNSISHRRGVISMARGSGFEGDMDSASSQFFICVGDVTALNGQYAAFGHVTEGMEILDQIVADAVAAGVNGIVPTEIRPIIKTVRILD